MLLFCAYTVAFKFRKSRRKKDWVRHQIKLKKKKKEYWAVQNFLQKFGFLCPGIDSENMQRINKDASLACEGIFFKFKRSSTFNFQWESLTRLISKDFVRSRGPNLQTDQPVWPSCSLIYSIFILKNSCKESILLNFPQNPASKSGLGG